MIWTYLGEKIDVKEDGLFYVKGEFFESLAKAKSHIAQQKKSYYNFSHKDIDNMFKKLSNKEKDFLKHFAAAYRCHLYNAYCSLGNTLEDFDVDFDYLNGNKF